MEIVERPLSYVDRLDARSTSEIDLLVVHCTELPDLDMAREYGETLHYAASRTGNCGHFYIDRDGRIEQWATLDRVAHHVRGLNATSIGVELVNRGRYPDWYDSRRQGDVEDYPAAQVDALVALIGRLERTLPQLTRIAGHEDLDTELVTASDNPDLRVRRKRDPGPGFPWDRVTAGTGLVRWRDATDSP